MRNNTEIIKPIYKYLFNLFILLCTRSTCFKNHYRFKYNYLQNIYSSVNAFLRSSKRKTDLQERYENKLNLSTTQNIFIF